MADRITYRVAHGPCHEALLAWRTEKQAVQSHHQGSATALGAVGFYPGSDDNVGNGIAIYALIFEGKLPEGWKPAGKRFFKHGSGQVAGKPDKRTAIGKLALEAIQALPCTPNPDKVSREIGFPMSLNYESADSKGSRHLGMWNCIAIGWLEDTFYVSLPDLQAERQIHIDRGETVTSPDWHPLEGMERILKEEADLDFARAKLKEAA